MMIKLDRGNYINTEAVEVIEGGDNPYIELRSKNSFGITPADRDYIVEAMDGNAPANADYDIHTDLNGDRYQLLTGREFIAALTDDAMQDEPIGISYPDISEIIPDAHYKAYLDCNAEGLSGKWEEV